MTGVAGQLADMIQVIDQPLQDQAGGLRCRLAANPAGHHHPGIQSAADDGLSLDEGFDLFVGELAIVGHESATIGMTGPEATLKEIERLPKTFVAEMRHIENDAQPLHLREQFASARTETARGVRALRVNSRTIMRRPQGAESLRVGSF